MKFLFLTSLLIALTNLTFALDTTKKNGCTDSKKIVGYFSEWRNANYPISSVDLSKLTHINYAFAVIDPDTYALTGYDGGILNNVVTAAHNQDVKVLMSVGGWYGSRYFSVMANNDDNIEKFAKSCKSLVDQYHVDGIDIDWEYPGREGACNSPLLDRDTDNYLTLLKKLREELGSDVLITAAVSIIPFEKNGTPISDLAPYAKYFDFINIMGYDFAGSWSSVITHHASLYTPEAGDMLSVSSGVKNWLDRNFPAEKIVVGVPAYGKSWIGEGLYKSVTNGNPQGDEDDSNESWTNYCGVIENQYSGNWKYKNIRKEILISNYETATKGWVRTWDDKVKSPYLFNKSKNQLISYDDPKSIGYKAKYVLDNNFAGMMVWEIENDTNDFEILTAINDSLGCSSGSNKSENTTPSTPSTSSTPSTPSTPSTSSTPKKNNTSDNNTCPKTDYKCCKDCTVLYEDDLKWGVLDKQWCSIPYECEKIIKECWAMAYGYPCCKGCDVVLIESDTMKWGIEDDKWCGIVNSNC